MPKQGIHLSRTHTFTTLHFDKNFFPAIRIIEILGKIIFLPFYHDPDKHARGQKNWLSKLEKNSSIPGRNVKITT